jgi:uncharacterized membrane protein YhaH (DUF805 family)
VFGLLLSFEGRVSRGQYWRAFTLQLALIAILVVPPLMVGLVAPPEILWWLVIALFAAAFVLLVVSSMALLVKRAHDLGKPGSWAFKPLSGLALLLNEGESHENRYGPVPDASRPGWRMLAGLGAAAIAVPFAVFFGVFLWGNFFADCKPTLTVEGASKADVAARWRETVAATFGRRYAESGLTIMSGMSCSGSRCAMSARPCVRR